MQLINFDSCNSCKRLVPSRLHELLESKFPFVSRIEFIRSKLSNFSAHAYGVTGAAAAERDRDGAAAPSGTREGRIRPPSPPRPLSCGGRRATTSTGRGRALTPVWHEQMKTERCEWMKSISETDGNVQVLTDGSHVPAGSQPSTRVTRVKVAFVLLIEFNRIKFSLYLLI